MSAETLETSGIIDNTPAISVPQIPNLYCIEASSGQLVGPWIESTVLELTRKAIPGQLEIFPGIDQIQHLPNATIQIFPELA